jgi:hypothetical protein
MRSSGARVLAAAALTASVAAGIAPSARAADTPAAGAAASAARQLSGDARALAAARASGHPVAVPGDTTATDTVTANPDGTLTLTRATAPVRKLAAGKWVDLDATLHASADGTAAPVVTAGGLSLSGGGSGPVATLSALGKTLAVSFPVPLPAPQLSGATATYADVWPGVDLQVTAGDQGSARELLVVRDAAAAADPDVRRLVLGIQAPGLTLTVGAAGDITLADPGGTAVFSAPTPFMWDSAPASAGTPAATDPGSGTQVDANTGMPLASAAVGPGVGARVSPVGAAAGGGSVTLTPDQGMLTSPGTVFPVYIDPTFTAPSAGSSRSAWTTVNNGFPGQSYWKTSGLLQVGYDGWDAPYFTARSFVNMPVPSKIYGATVISAQLNMTERWSPSCTARPVQAWGTGAAGSSTTWNSQPSWGGEQDSQTAAHGYSSSCPAAGVGFDVSAALQSAANGRWTQATFGLKAGDESDKYGWKQFAATATMSVTYDHPPARPAGLRTSPVTSCSAATAVGDGDVKLYVPVSDPDGGTLGVTLKMWKAVSGTDVAFKGTPTSPQSFYIASGSTAVFTAHKADLEAAAGGAVTEFYWDAQVTDYDKTSPVSVTCDFRFDATRPGAPASTSRTAPASGSMPRSP